MQRISNPAWDVYTATVPTPDRLYYFWIRDGNAYSVSPFAGPYTCPVQWAGPEVVAASDGAYADRVRVVWSAVPTSTGYFVYRNTVTNSATAANIAYVPVLSYNDTTALQGTNYYYWIRGTNAVSGSTLSAIAGGWSQASAGLAPATPTSVSASRGIYTNKVRVTWAEGTNATEYVVYRNASNNWASAAAIAACDTVAMYDDSAAGASQTNWYWVQATNAVGVSGPSASDTGWVAAVLGPPAGVTASDGTFTNKVRVSWSPVPGAAGYLVWRAESNAVAGAIALGSVTGATNYDDTGTLLGQIYYYWVQVSTPGAPSFYFVYASSNGVAPSGSGDAGWRGQPPPSGLTASDGVYYDKVRVSWMASPGAAGYVLYRNGSGVTNGATPMGMTTSLYLDDATVSAGQTNWYWALATNAAAQSALSAGDSGYRAKGGATTHGIPYWWLTAHNLPTNDTSETDDPDRDGYTTLEEYISDTDPTNPASHFPPLVIVTGCQLLIDPTSTARDYVIFGRTNLVGEAWHQITNLSGTGSALGFGTNDGSKYYKAGVRLPP